MAEGDHKIYVWVDPNNTIAELDESNNQFMCNTTVKNGKEISCYKAYVPVMKQTIDISPTITLTITPAPLNPTATEEPLVTPVNNP